MSTKQTGDAGERRAEEYLTSLGYKILDRNFRCKFGEIDLVAVLDETLVFVEVKTRSGNLFGLPEDAVNKRKLDHISSAGTFYASTHHGLPQLQRIDVVSIEGEEIRLIQVI